MSDAWNFADPHCCRRCLGPILVQGARYLCAVCRAEAAGMPNAICGCGIRGEGPGSTRGGFRCEANPAPHPGNPAAVLITFGAEVSAAAGASP